MKKKSKILTFVLVAVGVFVFGIVLGCGGYAYLYLSVEANRPNTHEIIGLETEQTFMQRHMRSIERPAIALDDVQPNASIESDIAVNNAAISIHFLELGNKYTGDCTYIRAGNVDILIDCGSKATSVPYVQKYLEQYMGEDKTLEYVIITHAHEDHYAGFATSKFEDSIFGLYECDTIITFSQTNQKATSTKYKNYKNNLQKEIESGATHLTAQDCIDSATLDSTSNEVQGYTFELTQVVSMTILNSVYYKDKKAATENDYSVCTLFTYTHETESHHYLFTGDLEKEGEDWIAANDKLPEVDLYKAGHHGSKTSSNESLMAVVQPKVVCVCCCAGSPEYTKTIDNQFPTQAFIDRIAPYTTEVYVTSLCIDYKNNEFESFNGNIIYMALGDSYNMLFSNNATKLKDSEWFNREITENGTTRHMRTLPTQWQSAT